MPADSIPASVELKIYEAEQRLMERLNLIDRQVADLQRDEVQAPKPWYHLDLPVLIALFAFLFSLGTTGFSYLQAREAKIHDARAELRALIQRLSSLPKENIQARQTYQNDPSAAAQISGLIQQENALLAKQAAEVMAIIPDRVSSSEYILVANAFLNSNLLDKSSELLDRAEMVIKDTNDGVAVYRTKGSVSFLQGDLKTGRKAYEQALTIFQDHPENHYYEETTHAQTEMLWAQAESGQKQCQEARKHIASSKQHLAQVLVDGIPNPLEPQVAQTGNFINSVCGTTAGAARFSSTGRTTASSAQKLEPHAQFSRANWLMRSIRRITR